MFRFIVFLAFVLVAAHATARDGDLDTSFAFGGKYTVAFDSSTKKYDTALRTLIDAQGRYITVGYVDYAQIGLVRALRDGQPDTSFTSGSATRISSAPPGTLTDARMDPSGRIVVIGYGLNPLDNDPFVCRFLADGTPDTTVGASGCRFLPVDYTPNGDDRVNTLLILENGKMYLAGTVQRNDPGDYDFLIMVLRDSDAAPDTSFGNSGIQAIAFDIDPNHSGGDDDGATALLQANGSLYIGGYAYTSVFSNYDYAFAKISASTGMLDASYCPNATACPGSEAFQGKRTLSFTQDVTRFAERVRAMAFGPVGGIIVAGEASDSTGTDLVLTSLQLNGSLSPTPFGNEGNRQRSSLFAGLSVNSLVSDLTGLRILVSGTTAASPNDPGNPLRILWAGRFMPNGSPDESFAGTGSGTSWVTTVPYAKLASSTPLDSDGGTLLLDRGRILLTGSRLWNRDPENNVNDFDFAIARFEGDVIFQDGLGN